MRNSSWQLLPLPREREFLPPQPLSRRLRLRPFPRSRPQRLPALFLLPQTVRRQHPLQAQQSLPLPQFPQALRQGHPPPADQLLLLPDLPQFRLRLRLPDQLPSRAPARLPQGLRFLPLQGRSLQALRHSSGLSDPPQFRL